MKINKDIEVVKFVQENKILVTKNSYIYYIADLKYNFWRKFDNAGNVFITIENYKDVNKKELIKVCEGKMPTKETDFMRLCPSSDLYIRDMIDLLKEDFTDVMEDYIIYETILKFLQKSAIPFKSFEKIRALLQKLSEDGCDRNKLIASIQELSFEVIGKDIFKNEISIIDGIDPSSYYWITPARVIDWSDTNEIYNVAEMRSWVISIEEFDVSDYLFLFFDKYFDRSLMANKKRVNYDAPSLYDCEQEFDCCLTRNFYTFESIENMLKDIKITAEALTDGKENIYVKKLREDNSLISDEFIYGDLDIEQAKALNNGIVPDDPKKIAMIINFYYRFIYRMEYMLKVGRENGYNLISIMGP